MAKKKITLDQKIDALTTIVEKGFAGVEVRMERGFAAVADDIADVKRDTATKHQIVTLHTQANSIETELRAMKHTKLQARVADLEEEVFGKTRA